MNCSFVRSIWPTISRAPGCKCSWLTSSVKALKPVVTSPVGTTEMRGMSMVCCTTMSVVFATTAAKSRTGCAVSVPANRSP